MSDENIAQILFRRRDALGRHLAYGVVRYRIRPLKGARTVACPCCGYLTLTDEGHDVCTLCFWCDDGQDDHEPDRPFNSPNGGVSLTQARAMFLETMTSLSPDNELYAVEQELVPLKRELVAVFDSMCRPIDGLRFVERFHVAHRLMAELGERRLDLHTAAGLFRRRSTIAESTPAPTAGNDSPPDP